MEKFDPETSTMLEELHTTVKQSLQDQTETMEAEYPEGAKRDLNLERKLVKQSIGISLQMGNSWLKSLNKKFKAESPKLGIQERDIQNLTELLDMTAEKYIRKFELEDYLEKAPEAGCLLYLGYLGFQQYLILQELADKETVIEEQENE